MGCSGSKPEDEDDNGAEVSLEIQDPPVNSGYHNGTEIYGEARKATQGDGAALSAYELTGVAVGVDVEMQGGKAKAFVRRSSGHSFKLVTKDVNEMRTIESNSTPGQKFMTVDTDVAQLQKSQGATKLVGSEFQGVATQRAGAAMLTTDGNGNSAVLNAQKKSKVVEDENATLSQLKDQVPQGQIKSGFGEFVDTKTKGNGLVYDAPTGSVANASKPEKFIEREAKIGGMTGTNVRTHQLPPDSWESTHEPGIKPNTVAPDAAQSEAALARARERAKKSKYGQIDTLPESMINAEPLPGFLVDNPVPVINKAGKTAIKDAHEKAAALQKKTKFDEMKILGAAAKDSKHHAPSPKKVVKMDLNDVAAQQAARAAEEAEFDEQISARLAEQKAERERKLEAEGRAAAAKAGEADRAQNLKQDMERMAAEKKAADDDAAAKTKADAKAAKVAARLAAAKAHQEKHGVLGMTPELRGAKQ